MVFGSAALGPHPGLESRLRQAAPVVLRALDLLKLTGGTPLPRVRRAIEQAVLLG